MKHSLTKSSIALLYFPHLASHQATNRLRRWMLKNPSLLNELYNSGYRSRQRHFTPRQFDILKIHLGEP